MVCWVPLRWHSVSAGHPLQVGIMEDSQRPVLQKVDIQLDAVAPLHSGPEGCQTVLRLHRVVEPPVGIGPLPQLGDLRVSPAATDGEDMDNHSDQKNSNQSKHGFRFLFYVFVV